MVDSPESSTMLQVLIRLPRDMHAQLLADAKENDRTIAATIRRAIRRYLDDA